MYCRHGGLYHQGLSSVFTLCLLRKLVNVQTLVCFIFTAHIRWKFERYSALQKFLNKMKIFSHNFLKMC